MQALQVTWRRPSHDVARELRLWLRDAGLSQSDVAAELGVSQSQVSRVLKGQFGRASAVAESLAMMAGVSLVSFDRPARAHPSSLLALLQDHLRMADPSGALQKTLEMWRSANTEKESFKPRAHVRRVRKGG